MSVDGAGMAQFKRVRLFAFLILVAAPLVYLVIIYAVPFPRKSGGEYDMMLYILLIVAMIQPAAYLFIERFHLTIQRQQRPSAMQPDRLFFTLSLIKFAFVEAIYIYGLVVAIISGIANHALYFYAIGIIWTFILWPRRGAYEHFMQKAHNL
ncbi:MAG: hypothetical protein OEW00_13285 [candidate division Zixibacteria bacterium]|nr:hypothetical protein [candidate division Zixibacteria bacterium]